MAWNVPMFMALESRSTWSGSTGAIGSWMWTTSNPPSSASSRSIAGRIRGESASRAMDPLLRTGTIVREIPTTPGVSRLPTGAELGAMILTK